ncbi:hypothetical protein ABE02_15350 [Bacillus licheniformis]|nr:hypothetical protein [Bacillus licheniformis]
MLNTAQAAGAAEAVPAVGAARDTAVGAAWDTAVGAVRDIAAGAAGTEACSFFIKKKTSPASFAAGGLL